MQSIAAMLIAEVNQMNFEQFVIRFGNVVELCPLFAAAVWEKKPFKDVNHLVVCFHEFIDRLPSEGEYHMHQQN